MLLVTFVTSLVFLFLCFQHKDEHPKNLQMLAGFTLSMAWSVGHTCAMYYQMGMGLLILEAVALTASVTVGLTMYTLRSKKDFSFLGAGLGAGLWVLLIGSLLFLGTATSAMHLGFAVGGAALFSLYIVYDVWLISNRLSPDEYITAAISLYLDIVNLFLQILRILAELNRSN